MTARLFEFAASSGALFIVGTFCLATIAGLLVPEERKGPKRIVH